MNLVAAGSLLAHRILFVKSAQDTADWDTDSDEEPNPGPRLCHAGHGTSDPGAGPSRGGAQGGGQDRTVNPTIRSHN